jgi:hypothetical protein
MKNMQKQLTYLMVFSVLNLSSPLIAQARIIGTLEAVEATQQAHNLATINTALARTEVQQQLSALGVQASDIQTRIAAMTESEINLLANKINSAPAGGDIFALVGVVFIVLLILEAVGVTDIFKKFP